MGRLEEKVVVVTGGASGIGEAFVRLFTTEGAKVVIADIEDERGRKITRSLGDENLFVHTDVTKEEDVRNVIQSVVDRWGRLDVMCNNAGIVGANGSIDGVSIEAFDRTVAVNLRGVFLGIKHAAPVMRRQAKGSIINTASTAAVLAGYGNHVYSACKAGIIQMTRTVSTELGEAGIRVNCISPGYIPTPMTGMARNLTREVAETKIPILKEAYRNTQPLPGPILPEDVAKTALFLASDDSKFINGHNLIVDGGVTAGRMWRDYQKSSNSLKEALEKL
jgi:NAD(P)-dependent dehydrogenase (short-subunit alcohol dehydrogenase family)